MIETKEQLKVLHNYVHNKVRMLKIGEKAEIPCGRQFPMQDVSTYLMAYAMHKNKWFDTRFDQTNGVLYANRVRVPSFVQAIELVEDNEEPDAL